jgi:hypothetical protein
MKFLKSLLMGTGSVVLAGLVLALLAPKAVHAVVATAVQVVNTSASPAFTEDTSLQASQIVTIKCQVETGVLECTQALPNGFAGGQVGPNGGYVVPANQYFVLKSMDTNFSGAATAIAIFLINTDTPPSTENVFPPANGQVSFSSGIVAGPGREVVPSPQTPGATGFITLHGYLTSN